jgi:hypothetical protein
MKITVSLTGGLGNQLFQLAAGLNAAAENDLHLSTSLGKPRYNEDGSAELLSFNLPLNVIIDQSSHTSWFVRKLANYLLRITTGTKKLEKLKYFRLVISTIASIPLSLFLREKTVIFLARNIGYSEIRLKDRNNLLFGYFQTYFWAENSKVKSNLMNISPKNFEREISYFRNLANIERPVVVHVRLTDYLNEKTFGVPTQNYYARGIEKILQTGNYNSIWLFSDDLQMASEFLPKDCGLPIRMIDQVNGSTALTFEIMRLGYGYVLANSTFSWWAAYLTRNLEVEVVAPEPWFIGHPDPNLLIPRDWHRILRY